MIGFLAGLVVSPPDAGGVLNGMVPRFDGTETEELFGGGQTAKPERIDNYPGFPDGLDG